MNYFYRRKIGKYASMELDQSQYTSAAVRAENIVSSILAGYQGSTAIRLWNNRVLNDAPNTTCSLVFRNPGVLRELLLKRDLLKLGEAYLSGNIDIEGESEALFDLIACVQKMQLPLANKLILLTQALRLPKWTHSHQVRQMRASQYANRNSRASISHHYDVSNNFYKLWLDPQMVYSCAYFRNDRQSLADAQCDKLDYICRKLRLQSGQNLLDIGCGWGALICWAARQYGVQSHGVTLSQQQYEYVQQRIDDEGLQGQVSVELCDYRDLSENIQYDRIVSVGMFEHVGIENFPRYFGTVKSLLKPGGLFLNHGITNDTGWQKTDLTRFINHYVFPDGELARISDVSLAMERSGFELHDVESLRRHYSMTLRHWVQALKLNRNDAVRESSEATFRLWQLYMSGSAYYFDEGSLNVYQILAGHAHQSLTTPLRRDDIYRQ